MNKKLIILMTIGCFFLLTVPQNSVIAILNDIELTDWDDYLVGDTSGSEDLGTGTGFTWAKQSGNYFSIQGDADPSGDRYLELSDLTWQNSKANTGYFNSSDGGHFGYYIKLWGRAEYYSSHGSILMVMDFRNQTNNIVVQTRINVYDGDIKFDYKDANGNWNTFYTGADQDYYVYYWQYYVDNVIQYSVYDPDDWSRLAIVNDTGRISGTDYTSKSQFNCSNNTIDTTISNWGKNKQLRIYEYGYNDGAIYGEDSYPELISVTVVHNGESGIHDTCIGATNVFDIEVIDEDGAKYCFYILDDEFNWVYGACNLVDRASYSKTINNNGTYYFILYDAFYPDTGYSINQSFDVLQCEGMDYDEVYGDFYVEFYINGTTCQYSNNDILELCYNLNNISAYPTNNNRYIAQIYSTNMGIVEYEFSLLNGSSGYKVPLNSFSADAGYYYEIRVFNTTDNTTTVEKDHLIYTSSPIEICVGDGWGSGTSDGYGINTDGSLDETDINFFIAIGVTLAFFGIGAGVGTKMKSENAELILGCTFASLGICMSAYFSLIPLWVPYTLTLMPLAYIIGIIYKNRSS